MPSSLFSTITSRTLKNYQNFYTKFSNSVFYIQIPSSDEGYWCENTSYGCWPFFCLFFIQNFLKSSMHIKKTLITNLSFYYLVLTTAAFVIFFLIGKVKIIFYTTLEFLRLLFLEDFSRLTSPGFQVFYSASASHWKCSYSYFSNIEIIIGPLITGL